MSATPTRDGHGKRSDPSGYSGEQREENDAGLEGFTEKFAELSGALAPVFSRRDLRANALAYVRGLLMPGVAGNCWAIAEAVGHARPHRLQHLLSGAVWDEDAARHHVRGFVTRHLGAAGVSRPDLVVLAAARPETLEPIRAELTALARRFPLALAGAGATAQLADAAGARLMAGDPVTEAERARWPR